MDNLNTRVLFSKEQLASRVQELGKIITQDYKDKDLLVVGVLKGSVIFMADLIRTIKLPMNCDFIGVSSYEGTSSTGHVRITHDLKVDIAGKDVLLVEDIIDTGLTVDYLLKIFSARNVNSLKVCSLLSKPKAHKIDIPISYVGFEISNEFVVGYGLDLDEKYRELPEVLQILD